ncbi:cell division protein SepF, partial [filamentous cyanobacterium CCP2]
MSLFQRLRDALGLNEEYEEYYYPDEETVQEPYLEEDHSSRRKALPSNVIGLPGLMMEVILMQPRSFEEIPDAVTALRERKAIILNLNYMDVDQAQRCADYVAGGA